jgi:hypothetical protein
VVPPSESAQKRGRGRPRRTFSGSDDAGLTQQSAGRATGKRRRTTSKRRKRPLKRLRESGPNEGASPAASRPPPPSAAASAASPSPSLHLWKEDVKARAFFDGHTVEELDRPAHPQGKATCRGNARGMI